jgi:hypothetical protein
LLLIQKFLSFLESISQKKPSRTNSIQKFLIIKLIKLKNINRKLKIINNKFNM